VASSQGFRIRISRREARTDVLLQLRLKVVFLAHRVWPEWVHHYGEPDNNGCSRAEFLSHVVDTG
jgi:hypothetical protein